MKNKYLNYLLAGLLISGLCIEYIAIRKKGKSDADKPITESETTNQIPQFDTVVVLSAYYGDYIVRNNRGTKYHMFADTGNYTNKPKIGDTLILDFEKPCIKPVIHELNSRDTRIGDRKLYGIRNLTNEHTKKR